MWMNDDGQGLRLSVLWGTFRLEVVVWAHNVLSEYVLLSLCSWSCMTVFRHHSGTGPTFEVLSLVTLFGEGMMSSLTIMKRMNYSRICMMSWMMIWLMRRSK